MQETVVQGFLVEIPSSSIESSSRPSSDSSTLRLVLSVVSLKTDSSETSSSSSVDVEFLGDAAWRLVSDELSEADELRRLAFRLRNNGKTDHGLAVLFLAMLELPLLVALTET